MEDDYTFEQTLAAALIENEQPIPLHIIAALIEQGVIIDEFIDTHLN